MAHAEGTVTINRAAADVYRFILDGSNNQRWRPAVVSIQKIAGTPDGAGARYKQVLKGPGGRPIDGDYEIVAATPNELIKFQVIAGPARPIGTYQFESSGNATTVKFILDYETKGMAKLMDPIISKTMQGEVATLSNLKTILEAQKT